jgi:hypothetical protein
MPDLGLVRCQRWREWLLGFAVAEFAKVHGSVVVRCMHISDGLQYALFKVARLHIHRSVWTVADRKKETYPLILGIQHLRMHPGPAAVLSLALASIHTPEGKGREEKYIGLDRAGLLLLNRRGEELGRLYIIS